MPAFTRSRKPCRLSGRDDRPRICDPTSIFVSVPPATDTAVDDADTQTEAHGPLGKRVDLPADPPGRYFVKKGLLYGLALGGVLGAVSLMFEGFGGRAAVDYWRDWILGGGALGTLTGLAKAAQLKWRGGD